MPRGGARVGAGRPRKPDSVRSLAAAKRAAKASAKPNESAPKRGATKSKLSVSGPVGSVVSPHTEPLAYMLQVMNDPEADPGRRDRMAVAAAPYMHPKVGEGGKKEQRSAAAKTAGAGRFAPAAPPKLVVSNR